MTRAYLDHAATTPMDPAALEAMLPYLGGVFGNPSGGHDESRRARLAVDDAREQIAFLLGADMGEIVFTSGGTEADNLAIAGPFQTDRRRAQGDAPAVLVCSAMEHHAVLNSCRALSGRGAAELREVASGKDGIIDLDGLAAACTQRVRLVSVMAVNNEIGTVQPIARVASLVRERSPASVVHTDAVQAVAWLDVATLTAPADLVSVSAHKFGGPKGIGVLVVRGGVELAAMVHGGGQERDRRSGTPNVAGIVGMAAALASSDTHREATVARVSALRDRLGDGLLATVAGSVETGERSDKVAGHLHLRFAGVEREALVVLLDEAGVAVSAGAACSSGAVESSHVLAAMGLGPDESAGGIRFSLGATTTEGDIDHALAVVPRVVARLRD